MGGTTRIKREREWDVMGWEEWTLEMEEAAPNGESVGQSDARVDGGMVMEGRCMRSESGGGMMSKKEWCQRGGAPTGGA